MKQVKQVKWVISVMVVLGLALAFVGCSKAPEAEQKAAKDAMDSAVSAGADKYAKSDFEAAKKTWDDAEAQMRDKKYKEAKQGYIDAKAGFDKAKGAVEAGKKAIADEVAKNIAALEERWKNLDADAKQLDKKMKDKKDAWTTDAKTISEGIAKAKEMAASDPAGAQAKADEIKGLMDKWEGDFKEMAAAPAKSEPAKKEPAKKVPAKK